MTTGRTRADTDRAARLLAEIDIHQVPAAVQALLCQIHPALMATCTLSISACSIRPALAV